MQIKKLKRRKKEDLAWIYNIPYRIMQTVLHQALFILNFLNLPQGEILTRAEKHFTEKEGYPHLNQSVWIKLAKDTEWQPGVLIHRGRGYGLVSIGNGQQ